AVSWEKSGIPAFNAGIAGQDRDSAYFFLKEFLKKQSPKVVVMAGMLFQNDHYEVQGNVYRNTLSMRNSKNFIDAVNAVVPENDKTGTNTLWDYYLRWPIIHSRYKEIEKWDFTDQYRYAKSLGYQYAYEGAGDTPDAMIFDTEIVNEISAENKEWVDKLLKLAGEEGFELLFVQLPGYLGSGQRADLNGCFKYLDEVGVKHIDFNLCAEEMLFDYVDDMSDGHHAKTSGAEKISEYLSNYLCENFTLEDKRGAEGYGLFDEAVEVKKHEKLSRKLANCGDLASLFENIDDGEDLVYSVSLKSGSKGLPEDKESILKMYLPSRDIWYSGGTTVVVDGLATEVLGGKAFSHKLSNSEYLYVNPVITEDGHADDVQFGSVLYTSESGNYIIVYDSVLGGVVTIREIN
ncbi:MAG: hypothetical protein J5626_02580, partial [Lachnospiraceae bacterium]|nr:hypothetical protein [Lachnospiraceae bacterium]